MHCRARAICRIATKAHIFDYSEDRHLGFRHRCKPKALGKSHSPTEAALPPRPYHVGSNKLVPGFLQHMERTFGVWMLGAVVHVSYSHGTPWPHGLHTNPSAFCPTAISARSCQVPHITSRLGQAFSVLVTSYVNLLHRTMRGQYFLIACYPELHHLKDVSGSLCWCPLSVSAVVHGRVSTMVPYSSVQFAHLHCMYHAFCPQAPSRPATSHGSQFFKFPHLFSPLSPRFPPVPPCFPTPLKKKGKSPPLTVLVQKNNPGTTNQSMWMPRF